MTLTTKNAWARYVRRRWPNNGVKGAMAEWGLTEGQAKGLVYAQASQSTIDAVLEHRNGGFGLGVEILAIKTGISLEEHIAQRAEEARHERIRWEAEERRLEGLRARRAGCGGGHG